MPAAARLYCNINEAAEYAASSDWLPHMWGLNAFFSLEEHNRFARE